MRNLDIAESRSRLEQYAAAGLIGGPTGDLIGRLEQGAAAEITGGADATAADLALDASSEGAAFDAGTD